MPPIIYIEKTESTNSYLKGLLSGEKLKEGTIVAANYQTAGRGQRGNSWESNKGNNLTFSMLLYPDFVPIDQQFIISQLVSLAIKNTLDNYVSDITIKWPNDIYWQDKKICGILIENSLEETKIASCIIGVGLNINQEIFVSNAPNPISLKMISGRDYNLEAMLKVIQIGILSYYEELKSGSTPLIAEAYRSSLFRKEGYYPYSDGKTNFIARIKDVLPSGHLVLQTKDGEERIFAFKEVKYLL